MYKSDTVMGLLIDLQRSKLLKRDMEEDVVKIYSLGNEYLIELSRSTSSMFIEDKNSEYRCIMKFSSMFREEITIVSDEITMSRFIDTVYFFLESPFYPNDSIRFDFGSTGIILDNTGQLDTYRFMVFDNPNVPKVVAIFNSELLSKFVESMYFMFLIDIDDGKMTRAKGYNYDLIETGGIPNG